MTGKHENRLHQLYTHLHMSRLLFPSLLQTNLTTHAIQTLDSECIRRIRSNKLKATNRYWLFNHSALCYIIRHTFSKHPIYIVSFYMQKCSKWISTKIETYLFANFHIQKIGCVIYFWWKWNWNNPFNISVWSSMRIALNLNVLRHSTCTLNKLCNDQKRMFTWMVLRFSVIGYII